MNRDRRVALIVVALAERLGRSDEDLIRLAHDPSLEPELHDLALRAVDAIAELGPLATSEELCARIAPTAYAEELRAVLATLQFVDL